MIQLAFHLAIRFDKKKTRTKSALKARAMHISANHRGALSPHWPLASSSRSRDRSSLQIILPPLFPPTPAIHSLPLLRLSIHSTHLIKVKALQLIGETGGTPIYPTQRGDRRRANESLRASDFLLHLRVDVTRRCHTVAGRRALRTLTHAAGHRW